MHLKFEKVNECILQKQNHLCIFVFCELTSRPPNLRLTPNASRYIPGYRSYVLKILISKNQRPPSTHGRNAAVVAQGASEPAMCLQVAGEVGAVVVPRGGVRLELGLLGVARRYLFHEMIFDPSNQSPTKQPQSESNEPAPFAARSRASSAYRRVPGGWTNPRAQWGPPRC